MTTTEALQTLVKGFFQQYLHRAVDNTTANSFADALQKGLLRDEDVVRILVSSDEYFGNI